MTYFVVSSLILALALMYPVSKLIWALSIRKIEKKTGRKITDQEKKGQLQRAIFLSFFLCVIFAFLFNFNVFGVSN